MAFQLNPTATTTNDDAGRSVPLWTPWCEDKDALSREMRERIQLALQANQSEGGQVAWGCGMVIVVVVLMLVLRVHPWLLGGIVLVAVLGMLTIQRRTSIQRSESNIRSTLLAMRCCASCAYDLRGLPAGDDGLSRCPECRAAWRLPKVESQPPGDRPVWRWNAVERLLVDAGLGFMLSPRAHSGVDDRGRAVEVVYPVPARRPPTNWDSVPEKDKRAIQRKMRALNHSTVLVLVVAAIFMTLAHVPRAIADIGAGDIGSGTYFGLALPTLFIIMIYMRVRYPLIFKKRKICDILLQYGRCGSCAGDLTGCAPEADGVTVCPSCRAAWKVPPRASTAKRDPNRSITYAPPRD